MKKLISPKLHCLADSIKKFGKKALIEYTPLVETLIQQESRNKRQIEQLLDSMLDCCFDAKMLMLFKKLCRYYFKIDPEAAAAYVHFYREMWDPKSLKKNGKKSHSA